MKKRIFTAFALALILAFASAMPAFAAFDVFTGILTGELDTGENTADMENAQIGFSIGREEILFVIFEEPVSFVGDSVVIATNVPVISGADAASTGARIVQLILDDTELHTTEPPIFNRDGYLAIDLTPYLAEAAPFSVLQITFATDNLPLGVEYDEIEPHIDTTEISDTIYVETATDTTTDTTTAEPPAANENGGFPIVPVLIGVGVLAAVLVICLVVKKSRR